MLHIPFHNRYMALGPSFYSLSMPEKVASPTLIKFNHELAGQLGIVTTQVTDDELAVYFSGNRIIERSQPLAMAYAGHQFGHFNPQLGDGRALLLGEVIDTQGRMFDVHLKGSGPTAYSRNGDGRAALGPVLREYLVSEAMAKLGVPTTRALAAVTTGERVVREDLLPGGVITRVGRSFVRVGTFEYFAARGDFASVRKLADYVLECNFAEHKGADNPYIELFKSVVDGQAALIAKWMQFGFIHGVMNTDNMSIACETIDYGPCAFLEDYELYKVYSYIDHQGRYAFGNQPSIGLWNLTRLAETLLPLFNPEQESAVEVAKSILVDYQTRSEQYWLANMRAKCGLSANVEATVAAQDRQLIEMLFGLMAEAQADFTLTFYYLSYLDQNEIALREMFVKVDAFVDWLEQWQQRLRHEPQVNDMQAVNPVYIPRNHQIEAAIRAAEDRNDFSVFHALHEVLQNPYQYQVGKERYMQPPQAHEIVHQTFCGT